VLEDELSLVVYDADDTISSDLEGLIVGAVLLCLLRPAEFQTESKVKMTKGIRHIIYRQTSVSNAAEITSNNSYTLLYYSIASLRSGLTTEC
jgi:hypothetical protein